jgi:LytS/YehU family sensor histidine kinase
MYFVIPKYILKGKYGKTFFSVVILVGLSALLSVLITKTLIIPVRLWYSGAYDVPYNFPVHFGFMAGLRGGITIGGLAAAIKLAKYWYVKEQRNLQLQKENIASQMQLLKAQVHPHFLFNTLNNIYSHTQKVSPTASSLVMGLSDLLRYILHEGNGTAVPLTSELKMIEDYMALEQVRYGKRLEINKELPVNTDDLQIAPLLLLPFIENCFKHGTSHLLDQAWIRLLVELDGNKLRMTIMNAKPAEKKDGPASGIGIANARKRLELLYPNKYWLRITEDEDIFVVNLTIELERSNPVLTHKESKRLIHA